MSIIQQGNNVLVTLSLAEMLSASNVGVIRRYESWKNKNKSKHGLSIEDSGCGIQVEGALGELAVAKAINRYWDMSVNTFKQADIGNNIQVRTRLRHSYDLIIRDDDNPNHVFVLVTGIGPEYIIRGWCYGHEGMKKEYLANHGGYYEAYFVPQDKLRPFKPKERDHVTDQPSSADENPKG